MDPFIAREYIEGFLKIKTKSGAIEPFRLNPAQEKLYAIAKKQADAGKPVRLIILKARQLGFSTLTEALLFHGCATRENVNALIVAHREDATANLFRMSKLFLDELPERVRPKVKSSNAQELVFEDPGRGSGASRDPGLRSRLRCATAGGRGIGRSDTLQLVHLSEYAFWPEGAEGKAATLAGILQAVPSLPGTVVVIESTANGYEDFKERWDKAVAGENDFEPVFFAWFENPEYTMEPVPGTVWTLEEQALRSDHGLTDGQLTWRRWCIANNCGGDINMFRQEYPANPDEAFLHSGTGVFNNALVMHRRAQLEAPQSRGRFLWEEGDEPVWQEDERGPIRIYEPPKPGRPYVLGGDTAGEGSDWFTAHIIDNSTGEQVASLHQRFSEPEYVREIYALGRLYNWALVGLETNYSTYPVMKLQELGYPNQYSREREDSYTRQIRRSYGFRTDRQTRPRAIASLVEVFAAHPDWFRDDDLLAEMLAFCYNEDHRPEALAGKHDDLVMAAAITYAIRHSQRMTEEESAPPKREKLIDRLSREQKRNARTW